jgi:hypothetical protein
MVPFEKDKTSTRVGVLFDENRIETDPAYGTEKPHAAG